MAESIRCLVIGANGFVGSHLVDELAEAGYKVIAFDRFSSPQKFHKNDNIKVLPGDIFDDGAIRRSLKNVDYVFHCFSATTPFLSDTDPYADITLNILRNVQLFEQFVAAGIKKALYISSGGAVYGSISEKSSAKETDAPSPVSPYGIGKLGTEYYLTYFKRKFGLKSISYRLTNPYGPRQVTNKNQGVVGTFIDKIKNNQEITVFGNSSRDYIYVRDATKMIVNSFTRSTKHSVYNIGSGQQIHLDDLITTIEDALNIKAKINRVDPPKTFLRKSQVSIDRFKNEFGEVRITELQKGILRTIKAHK